MKQVPFDVLMHAENALNESEMAYEVLNMWLDGLTDSDEDHSEACRVGAVMSLLHNSIGELVKAREAFDAKS
ncbi:hypothetical protein ACEOF8_004513 [Salmonella enterica]